MVVSDNDGDDEAGISAKCVQFFVGGTLNQFRSIEMCTGMREIPRIDFHVHGQVLFATHTQNQI